MAVQIDLDFQMMMSDPNDLAAYTAEAQEWVDQYANAPGVEVRAVRNPRGWTEVRLTAPSIEVLTPALVAYDAGNQGIDDLLECVKQL